MNPVRLTVRSALRLLVLACALGGSWAYADDYSAITTLLKQKKPEQALALSDKQLAKTPRDPQLLFLRAVAQSDLGHTDAAIEAYVKLTQDYPELPEPYNNLAALYASRNELEKARALLEMAVRGNPNYAVAYENLGDIYARMASEAYDKAQKLDPRVGLSVKPKLTSLRQMFSGTAPKAAASPASPATTPATAVPASPSAAEPPPAATSDTTAK